MIILGALLIATLWLPPQVTIVPGDSARGAGLFVAKGCIQCHSVNGQGGSVAPDLARPSDESHSPSKLAAELWNHSPMMWARLTGCRPHRPFHEFYRYCRCFRLLLFHRA